MTEVLDPVSPALSQERKISKDEGGSRPASTCSYCSSTSNGQKLPTQRGSARLRRISQGSNSESSAIEDKLQNLSSLLENSLLITEFPERFGETKNKKKSNVDTDDDNETIVGDFADELGEEDFFFIDGRTSRDVDYDTDLDMDFEEWINEDKREIENDKIGDRKYHYMCQEEGVVPVSYFLDHIQDSEFVMKYHGLGPKGAKAMAWPLQINKKIEKLNLEGNWIEGEGAIYLARILPNHLYLTELYLAENRIGNEGANAISEMLLKNDVINTLDLSGNRIDDSGGENLCRTLLKNSSVRHLYLSNNNLEQQTAIWFREVFSHNETLETVDLSWNHFRTRGAVAIGEGIMENYGLKVLNLAMNGFGLDGSDALGKALKNNRTLVELDISHNRITELGAACLALGIQQNDTLRVLKMGSNPLGGEGPLSLLLAVQKNDLSELRTLDLADVLVTQQFQELQDKLEAERIFSVKRGGVVGEIFDFTSVAYDPLAEFRKDPLSKLFSIAKEQGYRLMDLFKDFDKDNNNMISKDEFVAGIKRAGVNISVKQLEVIMDRLDKDKNGHVDFSELIQGETEHRQKLYELKRESKKLGRKESSINLLDIQFQKDLKM